jgi:hypothetical protein
MALSKLVCPECSKVLRPAKPVAPGKKVRCPSCEVIFVAEEDDEDDRPARAAAKQKPKKKQAASGAAGEEEEETYGVIRDESDEEDKPEVDYAPDTSIKDLRGPAQAAIMPPSNKLTMAGFIGVFGAVALMVLLIIPALLPVKEDDKEKPVQGIDQGLSKVNPWAGAIAGGGGVGPAPPPPDAGGAGGGSSGPKEKLQEEKASWYEVFGIDFAMLTDLHWALFLVALIPVLLLGIFSALVAMGGIKAQNLESRGWGIAGSIMAMFPLNTFCASVTLAILIKSAFLFIIDDDPFIHYIYIGLAVLLYAFSLASGIWTLITLNDEDVIAGFEYKGE